MKSQEQDTLHGTVNELDKQTSGEDEKQLRQFISIDETPFTAAKMGDKWILTMGKYKIDGPFETLEQCKESANDTSWTTIMKVVQVMIEADKEVQEEINNVTK